MDSGKCLPKLNAKNLSQRISGIESIVRKRLLDTVPGIKQKPSKCTKRNPPKVKTDEKWETECNSIEIVILNNFCSLAVLYDSRFQQSDTAVSASDKALFLRYSYFPPSFGTHNQQPSVVCGTGAVKVKRFLNPYELLVLFRPFSKAKGYTGAERRKPVFAVRLANGVCAFVNVDFPRLMWVPPQRHRSEKKA